MMAMWRAAARIFSGSVIAFCGVAHAQQSPSDFTKGTRYDLVGHLTGTILPDPDGAGALRYEAVRNTYDANGRLVAVEKGELASWQAETVAPSAWSGFTVYGRIETTYDALDRKTLERAVAGSVLSLKQISYDAIGRLECTTVRMNPAGFSNPPAACTLGTLGSQGPDRITKNIYDAAGQLIQIRQAVGTSSEQAYATYTYTPDGERASVKDANGNLAVMDYDGFDRLSKWTFPSQTTAGQTNSADYESYGYDAAGNRTGLRKRDGVTLAYQYDALNRMILKTVPASASGAAGYSVYYGYDLRGLQTYARFGSTSGQGITNVYDGLGRITSATTTMGGNSRAVSYQYDADGDKTRITHPDGTYFAMTYDGADRMLHADWWTAAHGTVPFMQVSYDSLGRRIEINRASSYTHYDYNGVSQLTGQHQMFAGGSGNLDASFQYNPASQMSVRTRYNDDYAFAYVNVNRNYAKNGLNQYTSAGGVTFGYDANGNLTSSGSTSYQYDAENRLVSSSLSNGTTLTYDPLGRLWQTASGINGKTQFVYDDDHAVLEYDGDTGGIRRRYMWGPGEDEPILQDEGGALDCSGTRVLHQDYEGSIVATADCWGNRQATNAYDEYGIPRAGNWGRFQYTGQAWLQDLGMYYYKARLYSAGLGRFMQTDPVGYDDQVNLYAYVANDPVNKTDPTGNAEEETWWQKIADLGRAAEKFVDDHVFGSQGQTPAKNVTFQDPKTGDVSRVDSVHKTDEGHLTVREAKANGSPLRGNQENVLKSVARGDAVPKGGNAQRAGLAPGQPVGQQVKSSDVGVARVQVGSGGVAGPMTETPIVGEPMVEPLPVIEPFIIP